MITLNLEKDQPWYLLLNYLFFSFETVTDPLYGCSRS